MAGEPPESLIRPIAQRWLEKDVGPAEDDAGGLVTDDILERIPRFVSTLLSGEWEQPL
jgi:hypothetical protein